MDRKIALLRAVNVGGRNLPMERLRACARALGWDEVETYIQSGNLLFRAAGSPAALEGELERKLEAETGLDIPVMIRTAAAWTGLIAANPFPEAAKTQPSRLVLFLAKRPVPAEAAAALGEVAEAGETLAVAGGGLWCFYPDGAGRSKLTPARIDKACGSPATGRNVRTLLALRQRLLA